MMNIPANPKRSICVTGILLAGCVIGFTHRASADIVHNDDVIIIGSLNVGFDAVSGKGFGFNTIILSENNLRIKFEDTSSSASFPSNDWTLEANDSTNGGSNHFAIQDVETGRDVFKVEAGARDNALFVESDGDIGIGTNNPAVDVDVKTGNTPTYRMQQDGSSGFTPQTWDIAGNESNFFIRDVTNGSQLPFRIRPGADSNSLFIDSDNDIGIGTSSPDSFADVHIRRTDAEGTYLYIENTNGTSQPVGVYMINTSGAGGFTFGLSSNGDFQITEDSTGGAEFRIDENATGNQVKFDFQNGATNLVEIQADGDVNSATGVFGSISDRNAKTDITPVDSQQVLARVAELPISTWRYKANSDELHMGPMAQDFWAAFRLHEGDKSIALNALSGVALAAIQGLKKELAERDKTIQELETRLTQLETRLGDE